MDADIQDILENFGYDSHTAHLVADQARKHDLTLADVVTWIREARTSKTIRNPRGFVRARIRSGDKPPAPEASRSTHLDRHRYVSPALCPNCQARPCVCDWDPDEETLADFRERILKKGD
ncbi:hypothetical protein ES703_79211 [subsurface metagenome]